MAARAPIAPGERPLLRVTGLHLFTLPEVFRQFTVEEPKQLAILRAAARHAGEFVVLPAPAKAAGADEIGCLVKLVQSNKMDQDKYKMILNGLARVTLKPPQPEDATAMVRGRHVAAALDENHELAARRSIMSQLTLLDRKSNSKVASETIRNCRRIARLECFIDYLALHLSASSDARFCHQLLRAPELTQRVQLLLGMLSRRLEEGKIERKLRRRVKKQLENTHKEYHLSEQAKAIQHELERDGKSEVDVLREKVAASGMSEPAREKCDQELTKLLHLPPVSPESSVMRTYVETMLNLPWQRRTEAEIDINQARRILDEDHYGLERIKDRVLEYLAVQKRVGKPSGSVMCFVGPPGVGKTSLGKSIARATGRRFVRVSLGGVHEEAAIRGHRKTYVASMPGRILKAMAKAGVRNPVFMLDEFDKMVSGAGFYGDPAAALLEVLDPEQNRSFVDQYVEVEFDLSEVMFITTANMVHHLPDALADRLETIPLSGYTDGEKREIARRHLIPKQVAAHGLAAKDVSFTAGIINTIIRDYTLEAGVRELDRSLAKVCRKIATEKVLAEGKAGRAARPRQVAVTKAKIAKLLEVPEYYLTTAIPARAQVGYATGLVYGEGVCPMEAVVYKSKESEIEITGTTAGANELEALGEVSQTILKSRGAAFGLSADFHRERTVHVHLQNQAHAPFGSLGACMFALLASVHTRIPLRPHTAVIGEINLRGEVIANEEHAEYKATVMDAQRHRIRRIVLPRDDARLIEELPAELTRNVEFALVADIDEVLAQTLVRMPRPRAPARPAARAAARKPQRKRQVGAAH